MIQSIKAKKRKGKFQHQMTNTNSRYEGSHGNWLAPTREELHKSFAGVLYTADFSTDKPSPWNIDRIARSLREDYKTRKSRE